LAFPGYSWIWTPLKGVKALTRKEGWGLKGYYWRNWTSSPLKKVKASFLILPFFLKLLVLLAYLLVGR